MPKFEIDARTQELLGRMIRGAKIYRLTVGSADYRMTDDNVIVPLPTVMRLLHSEPPMIRKLPHTGGSFKDEYELTFEGRLAYVDPS